jgi:hypothetical protein
MKTTLVPHAGERPRDAPFRVLGGNRSNAVSETWIDRRRLLGARWPAAFRPPASGPGRIESPQDGAALSINEA